MIKLLKPLFALILTLQASAFAEENVIACTEAGNLTHSFRKTDQGYRLLVNYNMYFIRPGYDPDSGEVVGQGSIGVDVPVENDNIRLTGLNWINEKAQFFRELFPPTELPTTDPVTVGFIELLFEEDECFVKELDGFVFASCRAQGPLTLNGMKLESIDFSMQNQVRKTLLSSPEDPNELFVGEVEAVYANMSFAKKRGVGTYVYRSSTTYYPNVNDIQCYKGSN